MSCSPKFALYGGIHAAGYYADARKKRLIHSLTYPSRNKNVILRNLRIQDDISYPFMLLSLFTMVKRRIDRIEILLIHLLYRSS